MIADAIIPAGGTIDDAFAYRIGSPYRALAPFGPNRTPVLQIVVDALRASGHVRRIIVAAPGPVSDVVSGVDLWIPCAANGVENILNGLAEADPDRAALVCASDHPFLSAAAITDFCGRNDTSAPMSAGLILASDYNAAYPDAPPSTFVNLRDIGPATLGCLYRVDPRLIANQRAMIDRLFAARKNPWQMAGILGPALIWRYGIRQLTFSALLSRCEAILGYHVEIVHGISPELAYDIDCVEDFEYAHVCLGQNSKS